jgi:hypothetical protein
VGTVVEFCGLPGAGKSTFARALVASLRLHGVPAAEVMAPIGPSAPRGARLRRKSVVVARGLLHRGGPTLAVDVAWRSRQAHARDRVARPANLLVVRDAVRRAAKGVGVGVLDQGPVQEWWSAALRADDARVVAWAANDPAPRADVLVRVDAPLDVLAARLRRRRERQSRLEGVVGADLDAELERGARLLDALCDAWCPPDGTRTLLRVPGLGSSAEAVAGVEAALRLRA